MRTTEFKEYLTTSDNTILNYVTYINTVEKNLQLNIDRLALTELENLLERINQVNFPDLTSHSLDSYKSAVRKYWVFRQQL